MKEPKTLADFYENCLLAPYREAETGGGHYAFIQSGAETWIYFQHSVGWEDWRHNLDFFVEKHKALGECFYCHRGFLKVWKGMEEEVITLIRRARLRGAGRIYCIGYSHGAALAILALLSLKDKFPHARVRGIGFGTPRVLWGRVPQKVKAVAEGLLAVRNPPDFVTHLPPAIFGYHTPLPMLTLPFSRYNPFAAHAQEAYQTALAENNVKKM